MNLLPSLPSKITKTNKTIKREISKEGELEAGFEYYNIDFTNNSFPDETPLGIPQELIKDTESKLHSQFLSAISSISSSLSSLVEKQVEKLDNLTVANPDLSDNFDVNEPKRTIKSNTQNTSSLQRNMDYSLLFPKLEDIFNLNDGNTRFGIFKLMVFRIENMKPCLIDDEDGDFDKFCVADCYLVLKIEPQSTESNMDSDQYNTKIYTWIGSKAELDKRFCCAMFAVGLKEWVGCTDKRILRQVDGEETPEFLALFEDFGLQDESLGTESGLYMSRDHSYPLRLYQCYNNNKKDLQLLLVCPKLSSITNSSVFILDSGLEIFQFNGKDSSTFQQTKARLFVDRLNKMERNGKANVVELFSTESKNSKRFKILLGEEIVYKSSFSVNSNNSVDMEDLISPLLFNEKDGWEATGLEPPVLYKVLEDINDDINFHIVKSSIPISSLLLKSSANPSYQKSDFDSKFCFILDCGVEMFLWIGRESDLELRTLANELLARIVAIKKRPRWLGLTKVHDGLEPEVFRLLFPLWQTFNEINWENVREGDANIKSSKKSPINTLTTPKTKMRADVRPLYQTVPIRPQFPLKSTVKTQIKHAKKLMKSTAVFVFQKGKFVQLAKQEIGHFCMEDSYLFLSVYNIDQDDLRDDFFMSSYPNNGKSFDFNKKRSSMSNLAVPVVGVMRGLKLFVDSKLRSTVEKFVFGGSLDKPQTSPKSPIQNLADESFERSSLTELFTTDNQRFSTSEKIIDEPEIQSPTSQQPRFSTVSSIDQNSESEKEQKVECVVYFWQGRRANKLALTTFQFKTRFEMEELMQEYYGVTSVRVVVLELGREACTFLAGVDNYFITHLGNRKEFLPSVLDKNISAGLFSVSEIQENIQKKKHHVNDKLGMIDINFLLYQIWIDNRFSTVRASQVVGSTKSLCSRGLFLVFHTSGLKTTNRLFVGKDCTLDPLSKEIQQVVLKILRIWGVCHDTEDTAVASDYFKLLLEKTALTSDLEEFFQLFIRETPNISQLQIYQKRQLSSATNLKHLDSLSNSRFFQCTCSKGYFEVIEHGNFTQDDLKRDSCVIIDGKFGSFIWCGKESSDVVRKLARKSLQVWFSNLGDGRQLKNKKTKDSLFDQAGKKRLKVGESFQEDDCCWVFQDKETVEFCLNFDGWDGIVKKDIQFGNRPRSLTTS